MAAMVSCADCRMTVPQSDSFFGTDGSVLCARCHSMREAHVQVERGRAAAYEQASGGGLIMQAIQMSAADDQALRGHGELAAIRRPAPAAAQQACQRCRAVVATSDITYSLAGESLCPTCSAAYDATADRQRLEGSLWRGLALGFFLSVVGVIIVHAMQRPDGEKRGALVGCGVAFVFYLFLLRVLAAGMH